MPAFQKPVFGARFTTWYGVWKCAADIRLQLSGGTRSRRYDEVINW